MKTDNRALFAALKQMEDYKTVVTVPTKIVERKGYPEMYQGWYAHPEHRPVHFWWCQMLSRQFFDEVGGFDERMREGRGEEDRDFFYTLKAAGAKFKWARNVHVETRHFPKVRKAPGRPESMSNPNHRLFVEKHGNIPGIDKLVREGREL